MEIKLFLFLLAVGVRCCYSQEVTSFSLINAADDSFIKTLREGETIDVQSVGNQLTIRADTSGTVGSVRFTLDGNDATTENESPYSLNGDSNGNYAPEPNLVVGGAHSISATIFSGPSGTGTAVASSSIFLIVIAPPTTDPPPQNLNPIVPRTSAYDSPAYNHSPDGSLTGELKKWHKVTLGFDGPSTLETANPNPFTFYRLDVTFSHSATSKSYVVPGYYAADGNAANTGATSGDVWLVHFSPDEIGTWTWTCAFTMGDNVAQNGGGASADFMNGAVGEFDIEATDKTGRDHRGKGRLQYVGEHHLQFAERGEWFLKAGADSPENFLAYDEFDNTPNTRNRRKSWAPHLSDYQIGDPTWDGGKGQAIMGAINYLAIEKGMNVFSFLPMNIDGDDKNVFPYISNNSGGDRQRIDISKTAQWEVVFEHADHIGLYLHFKTQETENDQLLDGGRLGLERKMYYRELIARFSHHLALNWNIGEENTNTDNQRREFADFFKLTDPYDFPVVVHTYPNQQGRVYNPLLGYASYNGVSVQTHPNNVFSDTLNWVTESSEAGRKWVVANDEQGNAQRGVVPDADDPGHDEIRKKVLWGNIMAGGAGVEYYFGYSFPNSDLTCEDFRSRDNMWTLSRYALDFFTTHVPFWNMSNRNELVSSGSAWCLSNDDVYVVYLQDGGTTSINLPSGSYSVSWCDPRNGGDLSVGSVVSVSGGSGVFLGGAPNSPDEDWAVLVVNDAVIGLDDNPTLAPVPISVAPVEATDSPMDPTFAPVEPTAPPIVLTSAPSTISPTLAPIVATSAPVTSQPTLSPIAPTASPIVPTSAPVTSQPTLSPIAPTASPVVPTSALVTSQPTLSPIAPTASPVVPTSAPVTTQPTLSPIAPTASPIVPTSAPVTSEPTLSPIDPTATPQLPPTFSPSVSASIIVSASDLLQFGPNNVPGAEQIEANPFWTYQVPVWWDDIKRDAVDDDLKKCQKRQFPPAVGSDCASRAKTCYWDNQKCPDAVGTSKSYPLVRCHCDGTTEVPGKWNCELMKCP